MIDSLLSKGATEINQSFSEVVDWGEYDWVIVMGGENAPLIQKLKSLDFSFDKMKDSSVYIGDSAGCMS
jgi:peptidase E